MEYNIILFISHLHKYTPDFQVIETVNLNILNQAHDFMNRNWHIVFESN